LTPHDAKPMDWLRRLRLTSFLRVHETHYGVEVSGLQLISEHVYWLPPAKPDRPSLCAGLGEHATLMLDSGASDAHARLFLDALAAEGLAPPIALVLTHSDWDHVFGAAEVGAPVIAHRLTDVALAKLAATDWSDEALDKRVASGERSPEHAANIKEEMPAPRSVRVARADTLFEDGLDLELGGVTVQVRHVGGDHAADSTVIYVKPDQLLFLGDALYESTDGEAGGAARILTAERTFPLLDAVSAFDAELYVEGHTDTVLPRAEAVELLDQIRWAGELVSKSAAAGRALDDAAGLAAARDELGAEPSELQADLIRAFLAGCRSDRA
jgi:glyoxylase-like metal-dependent hydrolase (beta-lactamase superfamily II)